MNPAIPQDQLARIEPIVAELRSDLRLLTDQLSFQAESALTFRPDGEASE